MIFISNFAIVAITVAVTNDNAKNLSNSIT